MSTSLEFEIAQHLGLNIDSIGPKIISHATAHRMAARDVQSHTTYHEMVRSEPAELNSLIDEVVIPETWFFRNPEALAALSQLVIHEWRPRHPNRRLRILSVPCSTGEEPYSIALTLDAAGLGMSDVQIDAIDISRRSLAHAIAGNYGRNSFRNENWSRYSALWTHRPEGIELSARIRNWVNFLPGNLASASFQPPLPEYDVIFCRNVLIYLNADAQTQAVDKLSNLLAPDGYFFVGPAEGTLAAECGLHSAGFPMAFAYRKTRTPPANAAAPTVGTQLLNPARLASLQLKAVPLKVFVRDVAVAHNNVPAGPTTSVSKQLTIARDLADRGRLGESLAVCKECVRENSTSAECWYLMALIHDAMGQTVAATECYRRTRYLDPSHTDASFHLAHLPCQSRNRGEARYVGNPG